MNNVLVTILLPVFNGGEYVEHAIISCLNQTHSNIELLIIDDCSSDITPQIIDKFRFDARVRCYRNQVNMGLIYSLNLGLEMARGEFVARMDADDISYPRRIELQLEAFSRTKSLILIGSGYRKIGASRGEVCNPISDSECRAALLNRNPFCHPSVLFRRDLFSKFGIKYDVDCKHAEDYKFFIDASKLGLVGNLKQPLLDYRVHKSQVSKVYKEAQLDARIKIITNFNSIYGDNFFEELFLRSENFDLGRKRIFMKGFSELLIETQAPINGVMLARILCYSHPLESLKFLVRLVLLLLKKYIPVKSLNLFH